MRLPATALRLVFATGYVLLGALGAGLMMYPSQRSEADRYVSLFLGVLLALIGHGHVVWASVPALLAGVLLWPVAVVLIGKIKPGGLWLTPVGLEYRKEAVSWTLPWPDVDRIDPAEPGVQTGALPYASGTKVAAVQPLVLALRLEVLAEVRRTVWWIWSRECRVPPGRVCIDCFDLAGGRQLITETIERHLSYPRLREQLGTEWSLPRTAR